MTRQEPVSDEFLRQLQEFANELMDGQVVHGQTERAIRGAMVSAILIELRQSRAAALTEEERKALRWIRNEVHVIRFDRSARCTADPHTADALAFLDRLLAKGAV